MKKLMYLLVAGSLSVFAACGGASTTEGAATDVAVEEVAVEEVAEAVGCQVEGGTCLEDHSCCVPAAVEEAAACCCGDATCDGSCHGDADAAEEAHGDHEGHDHE